MSASLSDGAPGSLTASSRVCQCVGFIISVVSTFFLRPISSGMFSSVSTTHIFFLKAVSHIFQGVKLYTSKYC